MKFLLASALCAVVMVASALAAWPSNPRLNTAASDVAGKLAVVKCYQTAAEWDARVNEVYGGTRRGYEVKGFTFEGARMTELSDVICRTAMYAFRVGPSKADPHNLGALIDVLAHESNHMAGVVKEADTEACARRYFGRVTHDLFGTPYRTRAMRLYTNLALAYSTQLSYQYQGGTCPR